MKTLREAAQAALEVFESNFVRSETWADVREALRAALAQPDDLGMEVTAVLSYCADVQQEGTQSERAVAQTVARMLARPPSAAIAQPDQPTDPLHDDAYLRGVALSLPEGDSRRWHLCRIADRIEASAERAHGIE